MADGENLQNLQILTTNFIYTEYQKNNVRGEHPYQMHIKIFVKTENLKSNIAHPEWIPRTEQSNEQNNEKFNYH